MLDKTRTLEQEILFFEQKESEKMQLFRALTTDKQQLQQQLQLIQDQLKEMQV